MIFHLFTLVFIVLKVMSLIHWSWLLVFLPSILALGIALLGMTVAALAVFKMENLMVRR